MTGVLTTQGGDTERHTGTQEEGHMKTETEMPQIKDI